MLWHAELIMALSMLQEIAEARRNIMANCSSLHHNLHGLHDKLLDFLYSGAD